MSDTITATEVVLPGLVEPDGLEIRTRQLPAPAAGQLLVRVEATGVSFAEKSMRRGLYYGQPDFPFVPGYDLVGTVEQVAANGDQSLVGRRVASLTKTGGWATHAAVSARDSFLVPAGLDPAAVETLIVNGITAWQMLHRSAKVSAGDTIVVHGANSGVSGVLIQLAHLAGVRVIGTASPRHHDALRAIGVEPIDYNDQEIVERVLALSPGGVAAVFDNVGGEATRRSWRMLAKGGALVCSAIVGTQGSNGRNLLIPFGKAVGQVMLWNLLPNQRSASFYNIWCGHSASPKKFRARIEEDLAQLFALLASGAISANIAARFPLTEAAAALALAESRTTSGKVILLP